MKKIVFLGVVHVLLACSTSHAIRFEIDEAFVGPNDTSSFEEFESNVFVSRAFDLPFRLEDGDPVFLSEQPLGGVLLLFPAEEGDVIHASTVPDYQLHSPALLNSMPMGESLYGFVVADAFDFFEPELNLYGLYSWLRLNRNEDGIEVVESVVATSAINGQRLPVLTAGSFEACFFDSNGDIDGDGQVAFSDFLILSDNFGDDVVTHTLGDIDCNGTVEFGDFLILSDNFGSGSEVANAPEPNSSIVLALGLLSFLGIRRKRIRLSKGD